MIRLRLEPSLTTREAKAFEARADAELRSLSNYVATLILEDLAFA